MQMHKPSKSDVGRRAWNILRLALLWARKGGLFVLKKRLMLHFIKSLRHTHKGGAALHYGDRQLSFDATPVIHVRMHRPNSMRFRLPHIPCINPHAAPDCFDILDFDDRISNYSYSEARNSFLIQNGQEYNHDSDHHDDDDDDEQICEEEGIDLKAEQFITNFYEQLKLQRQFNTRRKSD